MDKGATLTDDPVRVALAADDNYARPLCVTARSVISNLSPNRRLQIYVLDSGISSENKNKLETSFDDPRVETSWISNFAASITGLPTYGFFTTAAYARLLIPRLLPDSIDKVIYLDCDVLVRRDISELYDTPLGDNVAVAVPDFGAAYVSCPWGIAFWFDQGRRAEEFNFNTGVMLMNLPVWRNDRIGEKALEYARSVQHQVNVDQEAINVVAGTRIQAIDPHWNSQGELYHEQAELALPYTSDVRRSLKSDPWIIHYSNVDKPWHLGSTHPWLHEWMTYLDQTAYAGWRPPAPSVPARLLKGVAQLGRRAAKRLGA